jgi:hypothetical protein
MTIQAKQQLQFNQFLVLGDSATWQWFEKENLWPEEWGLKDDKKSEIMSLRPRPIIIPVVNAALRCFKPIDPLFKESNRPIFVSNLLLGDKHYCFSRTQIIAALLHEIGHVRHNGSEGKNAEFLADSFAGECGFKAEMVEVLTRVIKADSSYVPASAISEYNERIDRLKQ